MQCPVATKLVWFVAILLSSSFATLTDSSVIEIGYISVGAMTMQRVSPLRLDQHQHQVQPHRTTPDLIVTPLPIKLFVPPALLTIDLSHATARILL